MILGLKMTKTGIYYLYDYIPYRRFPDYSEEEAAVTKRIWKYKGGDAEALEGFTNEIMEAVAAVASNARSNKFDLVAVPPSKVHKLSAVRNSIQNMVNWYNQGIVRDIFGCSKEFYDYTYLLKRVFDIGTAHEGIRTKRIY